MNSGAEECPACDVHRLRYLVSSELIQAQFEVFCPFGPGRTRRDRLQSARLADCRLAAASISDSPSSAFWDCSATRHGGSPLPAIRPSGIVPRDGPQVDAPVGVGGGQGGAARSEGRRAVLLSAAVVTVFGLLAYGAGAIIGNTAGAITAIFGVVFLVPLLAQALPASWFWDLQRWLPGGSALEPISSGAATPAHHLFAACGEFAVFCGYAAVLLAIGGWLFCRRDA